MPAHISSLRFGAFELNLGTGELRKNGIVLGLPPQPFEILALLVSHAGELVTRDQIQEQVWGQGTFVDFEHGVNVAIQKIRAVLQDDAESPRYIETLPRRGYRFVANVENGNRTPTIQPNGSATVTQSVANSETSVPGTRKSPEARFPSNGSSAGQEEFIPLSVVPVRALPLSRTALLRGQVAALVLVVALLVVAACLWTYGVRHSSRVNINFNARDLVLVSTFENRTREPVLDGTVEFALERELSNSLFVTITPAQRVQDTLLMMKKPLSTTVDASLGREICLRDGGIRALINGRVEKFGTTYTLSAAIINPINGAEIADRSVGAHSQDGILPAVHELSNQLREILGEKLPSIQNGNLKLERVTTASLLALQFYSHAMADIDAGKWESGASLLEQALAEDPNFASAHILLAHCYANFGKSEQATQHFQKAFQLAGTTTDRERYFILGSYYQRFRGDPDKAIQAYEALVHLYPDHFWGVHNLTFLYWLLGRWRDREEMVIRRAELRPRNIVFSVGAGLEELTIGHVDEAHRYFAQAQALLTPDVRKSDPDIPVYLDFAPVWEYMRNGEVDKALGEADRLAQTFESRPSSTQSGWKATADARSLFANKEANLYFRLGKLKSANDWYRRESDSTGRFVDLSNVATAEGNLAEARRALRRYVALQSDPTDYRVFPIYIKLCADLGFRSELKKTVRQAEKDEWPPKFQLEVAKAALALAEGHNAQALAHLRGVGDTLEGLRLSPFRGAARDSLATALEKQGDFAGAIQALSSIELNDVEGPDLEARYHLARLQRKFGSNTEAQKIEADLLKRLKYADPDYPILVQLKRASLSVGVAASN